MSSPHSTGIIEGLDGVGDGRRVRGGWVGECGVLTVTLALFLWLDGNEIIEGLMVMLLSRDVER